MAHEPITDDEAEEMEEALASPIGRKVSPKVHLLNRNDCERLLADRTVAMKIVSTYAQYFCEDLSDKESCGLCGPCKARALLAAVREG